MSFAALLLCVIVVVVAVIAIRRAPDTRRGSSTTYRCRRCKDLRWVDDVAVKTFRGAVTKRGSGRCPNCAGGYEAR